MSSYGNIVLVHSTRAKMNTPMGYVQERENFAHASKQLQCFSNLVWLVHKLDLYNSCNRDYMSLGFLLVLWLIPNVFIAWLFSKEHGMHCSHVGTRQRVSKLSFSGRFAQFLNIHNKLKEFYNST